MSKLEFKRLEAGIDYFLRINERIELGMLAGEILAYAGMPSEQTFALNKSDEAGGNLYPLYFPARTGAIRFRGNYKNAFELQFDVRNITPERITLRYLTAKIIDRENALSPLSRLL